MKTLLSGRHNLPHLKDDIPTCTYQIQIILKSHSNIPNKHYESNNTYLSDFQSNKKSLIFQTRTTVRHPKL